MKWKKLEPLKRVAPNPCLNCPDPPDSLPLNAIIAVGFGTTIVSKDGRQIFDGERPDDDQFHRLEEFEKLAVADPDHDWQVVLHGPLHGETYQRHGDGLWVCVEQNEGFA
jgi:hypothetical protein